MASKRSGYSVSTGVVKSVAPRSVDYYRQKYWNDRLRRQQLLTVEFQRAMRAISLRRQMILAAPRLSSPPLQRSAEVVSAETLKQTRRKTREAYERRYAEEDAHIKHERPVCKSRPKLSFGKGGSRSFVPWCNRGRS